MKRNLRRIIAFSCVSVMSLMITGCSSETDSSQVKQIVSDSELSAENAGKTDSGSIAITIEEQELVNQDGIIITAKEYSTDSFWGDGIKFLIENNSDRNVTVSCDALMVNDYMINDLFSGSVASGKKSNETMNLYSNELEAAGIDTIGKIEVVFRVYDSDSWNDLFCTDVLTIKTSEYNNMDVSAEIDGTVLFDEGGIKIIGQAVDENSFWGSSVLLYIENNSGKNVIISCDDMSINGYMMTPFFSSSVYSGKKAVDDITIMSSELEENGITGIDEIELIFRILDMDSFMTITQSDPIKIYTK